MQPKAKPKRPQLTHFLCLPLINAISLPQLESSLATFKAAIPAIPDADQSEKPQPLIPHDAIRPVGTLHLTLGVMSLPTQERLDDAVRFFNSLDLRALMRQAEERATQKESRRSNDSALNKKRKLLPTPPPVSQRRSSTDQEEALLQDEHISHNSPDYSNPAPFTISLESLHALPRARSATVLHAAPVDPTSRLYPFCEMLRDRFLEAGFLQGEYKREKEKERTRKDTEQQSSSHVDLPEDPSLLQEMPTSLAEETAEQSRPRVSTVPLATTGATIPTATATATTESQRPKPKPRPLLLHATVANTIYIRGGKRNAGGHGHGHGKNKNRHHRRSQYAFDARDILAHYRDYYVDSERTVPRSTGVVALAQSQNNDNNNNNNDLNLSASVNTKAEDRMENDSEIEDTPALSEEEVDPHSGEKKTPKNRKEKEKETYPFVWARDFPIEAVCICEMGAKKLDPEVDESGMDARLGEKYAVVAERVLVFDEGV